MEYLPFMYVKLNRNIVLQNFLLNLLLKRSQMPENSEKEVESLLKKSKKYLKLTDEILF